MSPEKQRTGVETEGRKGSRYIRVEAANKREKWTYNFSRCDLSANVNKNPCSKPCSRRAYWSRQIKLKNGHREIGAALV